jgi:hypothetical protein
VVVNMVGNVMAVMVGNTVNNVMAVVVGNTVNNVIVMVVVNMVDKRHRQRQSPARLVVPHGAGSRDGFCCAL